MPLAYSSSFLRVRDTDCPSPFVAEKNGGSRLLSTMSCNGNNVFIATTATAAVLALLNAVVSIFARELPGTRRSPPQFYLRDDSLSLLATYLASPPPPPPPPLFLPHSRPFALTDARGDSLRNYPSIYASIPTSATGLLASGLSEGSAETNVDCPDDRLETLFRPDTVLSFKSSFGRFIAENLPVRFPPPLSPSPPNHSHLLGHWGVTDGDHRWTLSRGRVAVRL